MLVIDDWDKAKAWEVLANADKNDFEPKWSFDCGFKLDFDGNLLHVCSRYYRDGKGGYGGVLDIFTPSGNIVSREFSATSIDLLKQDVEKYIEDFKTLLSVKLTEVVKELENA